MSSRPRRPPRPPTRRAPAPPPSRRPLLVVIGVIAVVLVALAVALIAGGGDGDDTTGDAGREGTAGTFTAGGVPDDTPATATGDPLTPLGEGGTDPAAGQAMPVLSGTGMDGEPLTVPAAGRPTMIVFLAHWCPHCQAELPVVQQWIDDGGLPEGVDMVAVSTAVDARRPNYPPAAWLDDKGWTAPVLVDGDGAASEAVGLTAFPFFVAVGADGTVVGRASGELTVDQLDGIAAELAG